MFFFGKRVLPITKIKPWWKGPPTAVDPSTEKRGPSDRITKAGGNAACRRIPFLQSYAATRSANSLRRRSDRLLRRAVGFPVAGSPGHVARPPSERWRSCRACTRAFPVSRAAHRDAACFALARWLRAAERDGPSHRDRDAEKKKIWRQRFYAYLCTPIHTFVMIQM